VVKVSLAKTLYMGG